MDQCLLCLSSVRSRAGEVPAARTSFLLMQKTRAWRSGRRFYLVGLIFLVVFQKYSVAQEMPMATKTNLIVFVHGLMGDSRATWTNAASRAYWPDLLKSDPIFGSFDIESYSYPAGFAERGQSLNELAIQFSEYLIQLSRKYDHIFLVGHSYGGVISLDAIMKLAESDPDLFDRIQAVFLLGSPFRGTPNVTKTVRYLAPNLIFEELKEININSYLQALDSKWRNLTMVKDGHHVPYVFVTYETKKTRVGLLNSRVLVDLNSLFPHSRHDPYPARGKDHHGIAKPLDNQDDIYLWVAERIKRILEGYSPIVLNDLGINLGQSGYLFDTQSHLPENLFLSKRLPPVRIFTELPYSTYSCFDFEEFRLIQENSDRLVFSNEASSPAVIFRFYFVRKSGNLVINFEDMVPNEKRAISYVNRLDFMRFQRALMSNARIVFWDINKDAILFRTGHTLPTNLMWDKRAGVVEELLHEIVRIERAFQIAFDFHRQYSQKDLQTIEYVHDVLNGKEIEVVSPFPVLLSNATEKQEFLKQLTPEDYSGGYRHHFHFTHEETPILGTTIDLGEWTLRVPEATFDPPIDVLRKTLGQDGTPVVVKIQALTEEPPMTIWHHRQRMKHDLPPASKRLQEGFLMQTRQETGGEQVLGR